MFNPDYPTDEGAGFLQHTYQNAPRTDVFFWNGFNGCPAPGCYNDGSRRNMMNPVNPAAPNPFTQFGQTQQTIPESAVQPFSSYPPAAPTGLNAAIESRRNVPPTPVMNQNNPWAKSQAPTLPGPSGYAAPPAIPQPMYFDPNPYGGYYGPDANAMSLYDKNSFGFDKRSSWENYYTQNRPFPMPTIDWRAQNQNDAYNGYYPNQCGVNPYQIQPFPTAPMNWKDKAMENWSYQQR